MGARAGALAADEIAVAGRGAALARRDLVGVHGETGRAAGLPPFEARGGEDAVQPLRLGLALDQARAGDGDRPFDARRLGPPREHGGGSAQILDPAVGAAPDEDVLDRDRRERCAGLEAHISEALRRRGLLRGIGEAFGRGDAAADRRDILRAGAPGDGRLDLGSVDHDRLVEGRATIRGERTPPRDRLCPSLAARRHGAALQPVEHRVVGGDQPGAGAALDAHVADRQPALDAHLLEHAAAVFDDMAGAASGADAADDVEDEVLGRDAGAERALDAHLHGLRRGKQQRLRRQHMFDLAGADPEGERADAAMRGGVAVAADDGGAGEREALFRPDHMNDALRRGGGGNVGHAEFGGVALQRGELRGAFRIRDRQLAAVRRQARSGGQVVVGDRQGQLGPADPASGHAQALERLRAGHFVHEMAIDIEEAGAVRTPLDDMRVPDLFVKRSGAAGHRMGLCPPPPRFKMD